MITLLSSPSAVMPVYNPIYSKVSSDKTTEEAFSFIFDVYVNGTFVNRDKLLPRPGTSQAVYSPARILESYLDYDLSHNIVDETVSQNCIDNYSIEYGEEYVAYWNFNDTVFDSWTLSSYTVLTSTIPHNFALNDSITIIDTVYGGYNSVHTITGIIDAYKVIINRTFVVTPTNPGRATWADKRKTEFMTFNQLVNPDMIPVAGSWSTYGPDAGGNELILDTPSHLVLNVQNKLYATNATSVGDTTMPLVPGQLYRVKFRVLSVYNPTNTPDQFVQASVGGNLGLKRKGAGTWSEIIECGNTSPDFALILSLDGADTDIDKHYIKVDICTIDASIIGYAFNGVLQYEEVPVWDYTTYKLDGPTKRFLTNQPKTVKTTINDRGSIGFMNLINIYTPDVYRVFINSVDINGTPNAPVVFDLSVMGLLDPTGYKILEIPAYPWNINQWSQSVYSTDIITATTASYSITVYYFDVKSDWQFPASETLSFELDHCGTRFEPVRFMFLNSLGQFDYFNATLLSRTTLNSTRDTYTKTLEYDYQVGDRGKTIINVNSQESYTITTDWVSQDTAHWLTREFFNSTEHYVLDNTTGAITPIVLDITSMEDKKRINDKLLNYTFNYSKAVPVNTTRG